MSSEEHKASAAAASESPAAAEPPAIERGSYEILRDRLLEQSRELRQRAEQLNDQRLEIFGSTELVVVGNERIRTDNNCLPRDIQPVGRRLLFGYKVFIGLKTETQVADVLSLHTFTARDGGLTFEPVARDAPGNFLSDPGFIRDFKELYKYYKDTRLLQLRRLPGKLLAIFQTGASVSDLKVFRWAIDADGEVTYIDNRGERDHVFPPSHDFEWIATGREQFVLGRHPHVNILDEVFVETVGGDLTVKVEDNTEDGLGIYREPVEEPDQSLDDAQVLYAKLGTLIVLKILPYNESEWRYLVFNTRTESVTRIDAIGQSCVQLPEDHGLIFPGGYYLQSGETKSFDGDVDDMEFKRVVRSPNGEDVLYIFHRREDGRYLLLPYNMIRKAVQNPIQSHGFGLFDDGKMVVFRVQNDEPTRVHAMQIWQTPFATEDHAARAPRGDSFLDKIGNADLVRGISDALSLCRMVEEQAPSLAIYEDLIAATVRLGDSYYWLDNGEAGDMASVVVEIRTTADAIVGEFEKVEALRRRAVEEVETAQHDLGEALRGISPEQWRSIEPFVTALSELRRQRGHLIGLKDLRYVAVDRVTALEEQLVAAFDDLSQHTVEFLSRDDALAPYRDEIERLASGVEALAKVRDTRPVDEKLGELGSGLELLTEILDHLEIDDATVRTAILERISEVLGRLNRARALLVGRRKELLEKEGSAEFAAQFKLFSQSVSGALGLADSPEKCDEQLSKLLLSLEELESRFGDLEGFLEPLATKREEVYEAFSSKKQSLLEARQRRAQRLMEAAERILDGVVRRAARLEDNDALNGYFAGDAMVAKVRDIAAELRQIKDSVRADELDSRLKTARQDAARALRDRLDIFEEGAEILKLGRHRFSVNTRPLELTLVPTAAEGGRGERGLAFHLTGTDFHQPVRDEGFAETRAYWDQLLISETSEVYRGEYLAYSLLRAAEEESHDLSLAGLQQAALADDGLLQIARRFAEDRYDEGYERGLHDHDAALILGQVLSLYAGADLLRFAAPSRAAACLFWAFYPEQTRRVLWERRAKSLARLRQAFGPSAELRAFAAELGAAIGEFHAAHQLDLSADDARLAGAYLLEELARQPLRFTTSSAAERLRDAFRKHLDEAAVRRAFDEDLQAFEDDLGNACALALAWLRSFLMKSAAELRQLAPVVEEAVVLLLTERRLERTVSQASIETEVKGLLGQHPLIVKRRLALRLDVFLARLEAFVRHRVPGFRRFQEARHRLLEAKRRELRLDELQPKVMSAFVRNRLIDQVYLPLIGDNLAKQLGTVGEGKRTDQMGLLLLISPPGYGKTTLMEYIANRLGMTFVKINGPALGHAITSLDPSEATSATARQEVAKINFALEMGNNVLLYLDDIQHTHPELLQKFISLCDAQRRIEGVFEGRTRTYDLRGKRFAVCMAGNPYTESGEKFQIPDMLANRADTYNLGDVLAGREELFASSYLENSLTSNPALAPLATRDSDDFFRLLRMARGEALSTDQLKHNYAAVELEEILAVLKKLLQVQKVLLAVNQQYILSASQDDAFRTEPRFQLQGSYRNMNKLAEKIVAVMNDEELEALIDDHYAGEAQTLTTGAEHNLLKLGELRGTQSPEQEARWREIKRSFARLQVMGGAEDDPAVRVIGQLGLMSDRLQDIGSALGQAVASSAQETASAEDGQWLGPHLERLGEQLAALAEAASRPPVDAGSREQSERLTERLEQTLERLGALAEEAVKPRATVEEATGDPAAGDPATGEKGSQVDFTPYLGKLDETLKALVEMPRGGEIVQTLAPGVHELLERMTDTVGEHLLPLVKTVGKRLKKTEEGLDRGLTDHLDKTLKNLDQLKDLLAALRKIDTRSLVR